MNAAVTAVIVTYNSGEHIGACLDCLDGAGLGEIIVIDNASADATRTLVRERPGVTLFANERNVGYTAAVNQGLRACRTPFTLILNPDVRIEGSVIEHLARALVADAAIALIAPKLVYADGRLQYSCRRFPNPATFFLRGAGWTEEARWMPRVLHRHLMMDYTHDSPRDVDWALGACLLGRCDRLAALRYLDERYFLYYSDIDLCWRVARMGWRVRYDPRVSATHHYGRGSASAGWLSSLRRTHAASAARFFLRRARLY